MWERNGKLGSNAEDWAPIISELKPSEAVEWLEKAGLTAELEDKRGVESDIEYVIYGKEDCEKLGEEYSKSSEHITVRLEYREDTVKIGKTPSYPTQFGYGNKIPQEKVHDKDSFKNPRTFPRL